MTARRTPAAERAIGYVRVSTEKQDLGLHAQRRILRTWCATNHRDLTAVHVDHGISGGAPIEKRPALIAAIDALRPDDVLLVAKRDRLARDVVAAAMIERLVERAGARVQAADGAGNGAGPEAQLMRHIIDAFAEYERGLTRFRTRSCLAELKAQGKRIGGIPFGYALASDGATLVRAPAEVRTLQLIRRLRDRGATLSGIVDRLNDRGVPARGERWYKNTIVRILKSMRASAQEGR